MKIIKNPIIVLTTILLTAIVVMVSCKKTDPIETTGHITGIVTEDGSNEPVFAANVTLSGISSNYKTGGDGKFEIKDLDEGDYTITVEKTGYQINKKQVTVKAGRITTTDFSLKKNVGVLSVSPSALSFGATSTQETLSITNGNEGTILAWEVVIPNEATWLSAFPKSGETENGESIITVSVDRSSLEEDKTYAVNLIVRSTNGGGSKTILITCEKPKKEVPILSVSPSLLNFGSTSTQETLSITNAKEGTTLDWEVVIPEEATWLSVFPKSGQTATGESVVTVSVDRSKMTEQKTYSTNLIVRSTNGGGSKTILVTSEKLGAVMEVDPVSLNFGTNEIEKSIIVRNLTQIESLTYNATANESWITLENSNGTITESEVGTIKIKVSRLNLAAGNHNGSVVIKSNKNTITIKVSMNVLAKQAPSVSALQSTEIKHNSAAVSAYISDVGSAAVTAYGFCWGTSPNPTTADNKNNLGGTSTAKSFNTTITGLTANTLYYLRAYATNEEGTSYSDAISFTTATPPTMATVRTFAATDVKYNQATGKGSIDNLGDGYVTSYGFCISKNNPSPTLNDQVVNLGSTTTLGDFEGTIPNLQAQTKYFVRAFATNSLGTAYGGTVEFTTPITPPLVTAGLIAYYTFDNSDCEDYFGEVNYGGILQGTGAAPTFVNDKPGLSGKAMKCTGGQYYHITTTPDKNANDYTHSVWIKTTNTGYIYWSFRSGIYLKDNKVSVRDNGHYHYYFNINLATILFDGRWHHLVITRKGGQSKLYVDGRFYEESDFPRETRQTANIGHSYTGLMDNLRLYNRALTIEEIREIYQAKQ